MTMLAKITPSRINACARRAIARHSVSIPALNWTSERNSRMKIPALPFTVIDWPAVAGTDHAGETGKAIWRMFQVGDLRIRQVEYTPGYLADHWCDRGHVLYVLEGELETELKDGRRFTMKPGMSYQVSDFGDAAHRSSTKTGAKLFIVD